MKNIPRRGNSHCKKPEVEKLRQDQETLREAGVPGLSQA